VLVRNQQCRLTELHKFCSVFYFLGDYESAGNPTNASEGSLGPRGRYVSPAAGPLTMFVRRSSVGFAPIFGSVVNAGFPGGICHKAFAHCTLITGGNRRWTC
jgi:hypothetical protein